MNGLMHREFLNTFLFGFALGLGWSLAAWLVHSFASIFHKASHLGTEGSVAPYAIAWFLGVPFTLLVCIFVIRGCV